MSFHCGLGASTATSNDYDGLLDDIRIYNRALSVTDIGELYDSAFPPSIVANDDSATTTQDTSVVIDVSANDIIDLGTTTIIELGTPGHGSVIDNGDGTVTYTPDAGYTGSDSFEYTLVNTTDVTSYWGLDGDASDSVGSNAGTIVGASTVEGNYGDALSFDEVDDHVVINDFATSNEFSLSLQFKVDDNSGSLFQYLVSYGDINSTNSLNIFLNEASHGTDPNVLRTVIRDANDPLDNFALQFDASSIIGDGLWHTYTLTVESGVGSRVYLDGVLKSSSVYGGDSFDPASDLYLGARQDLDPDRQFGGSLDSVQFIDRALSPSEVVGIHDDSAATGTVSVTILPASSPPGSIGGSVSGVEDSFLYLGWSSFNVFDSDSTIKATTGIKVVTLPVDGTLEYFKGSLWTAVSADQVLTKSMFDGGEVRFSPDSNEAGDDSFLNPGTGDGFNDYATFEFEVVHANTVNVINPGGEDNGLAEGDWQNPAVGWTTSGADAGSQNTTSISFSNDHDHSLYTNAGATLSQTLSETFTSTNNYNLTVEIGFRDDQGAAPEYQVELWAGGTRLGYFDHTNFPTVKGEFVTGVLEIDGSSFPGLEGQLLELRLVGLSGQTNYDNIELVTYNRTSGVSVSTATLTIDIAPVNDDPTNTGSLPSDISVVEELASNVDFSTIALSDIDHRGGNLTVSLNTSVGGVLNAVTGAGVLVTGSGTDSITLTGNLANLNAYFNIASNIQYTGPLNLSGDNADKIQVQVTDNGNFGAGGGGQIDLGSVNVDIVNVNDSPTVGSASVPAITEGTTNPPGESILNLFSGSFNDVDPGSSMSGILITHNPENASQGVWQYSTDAGSNWFDVGTIAYPSSLALDVSTLIRFVPTTDYNGTPSGLSLRALDNSYPGGFTVGSSKVTFDASLPGGTSPISSSLVSINTTVFGTNDAPIITGGSTGTISEGTGVAIFAFDTVTDVDSADFNGGALTVSIAANGELTDQLAIANLGGVTTSGSDVYASGTYVGTFSGGTAGVPLVVNFNGNATAAHVELVYQATVLFNLTDDPVTTTRTVEAVLTDGDGGTSNTATANWAFGATNDTPFSSVVTSSPTFNENSSPVTLFASAMVDLVESADLVSSMVFTIDGLENGSDEKLIVDGHVVELVDSNSETTANNGFEVSVTVSGATATVTITKPGGFAAVDAESLLNTIAYNNTSDAISSGTRTVTYFSLEDDGDGANTVLPGESSIVTVQPENDAPTVTDGANVVLPGTTEDIASSGTTVSAILGNVNWADVDPGAELGIAIFGITGNGTWQYSTDGAVWNSLGAVSSADAILLSGSSQIRYVGDGENGEVATFEFRAWDQTTGSASTNSVASYENPGSGGGNSAFSSQSATATINVSSVNDAPTQSSIETANLVYSENELPKEITNSLSITDVDNALITSAVVQITGNYVDGEDVLAFSNTATISGIWDAATGTLSLSGSDTKANYEAALRSVTYENTSEAPSNLTRTISLTVNDGISNSNTLSRNIEVTPVNDDPFNAGGLPTDVNVIEDVASSVDLTAIDLDDLDHLGSVLTVRLNTTAGTLAATAGGGVAVSGSGSSSLELQGTLADLNSYLNSATNIQYLHSTPHTYGDNADFIRVIVNDNGNSGSGGGLDQILGDINVDISGVNDQTSLGTNTGVTVLEGGSVTLTNTTLNAVDVDDSGAELTYTITSGPTNGILERVSLPGIAITSFTQAELDSGTIRYVHNGSETTADQFSFQLADGLEDGTTHVAGTFNISITPLNDNAPTITSDGGGTTAILTVDENSTAVTQVTATDSDLPADTLTFSIVGGNDASLFTIDSATGQLEFVTAQDYENPSDANLDRTYEVTVQVSDGTYADTQAIEVVINDVNETGVSVISDTNPGTNAIAENSSVGTSVGLTAFATDSDPGDTVTYSLDNDDGGRFSIDTSTGVVTVAGTIDRELDGATRTITVRATSTDGSFQTQTFSIAINDVDEYDIGPVTDSDAAANEVLENATVGTSVGIIADASDLDATTNNVTYSLTDNDGGRFAIDSVTGEVTVAGTIDRETDGASRNITVRATSTDGSFSEQTFSIAINDVDEYDVTPVTDSDAAANEVLENATVGTSVGIIADASDLDATTNNVTYSLTDNDGGRFAIDSVAGEVTVAGSIDRETDGASRSITVRATSADGSFSDQTFSIAINDVDEYDVSPVSDTDVAANEVLENATVGTSIGIIADASDLDATTNNVTYSLTDNDGGRFAIDSVTGEVTVAGSIDRETDGASRSITVRATSADGSFSEQTFSIAINDVDEYDVTPVTDSDAAANEVLENATVGTSVGIIADASDLDATTNNVTYSLTDNDGGRFAIDSVTGEVTVAGSIDRETDSASRSITVRATSADGSFSDQTFSIAINDVDEYDISPVTDSDAAANEVLENATVGTSVGIIADASDLDATTNNVTYSLTDNDSGRFAIDSVTGEVTVAGTIDRETDGASRSITVRATSADGSFSEQTFSIAINDVDEYDVSPVSDTDVAANEVLENATVGTSVGIIAGASDLDATTNSVTYSLTNNDGGRFAIDSVTGEVTVAGTIDRETDGASRNITVRATSADGSFSDQTFSIAINDVDEYDVSPVTDSDAAANEVLENATVGTSVGIIADASDLDATTNNVTYSLSDDDGGRFSIDALTGEITTAQSLDFESLGPSRDIVVRATSEDGSYSTRVFTISIVDVNEAPSISLANTSTVLVENTSTATSVKIADIVVNDDAIGINQLALGGLDASSFEIIGSELHLRAGVVLDFEVQDQYDVTVSVTDASLSATDSLSLTLSITNVDDVRPVVQPNQVLTVSENSPLATLIGSLIATDVDTVGPLMDWTIADGNQDGVFALDPYSGELIVTDNINLNFEANSSYALTVSVSDGTQTSDPQVVLVNVLDVNEQPVGSSDQVFVNQFDQLVMDQPGVLANDLDEDGDPLTAVLTSQPANGTVTLSQSGTMVYTPNGNFFGTDSFTYVASDGQLSSAPITVTVVVSPLGTTGQTTDTDNSSPATPTPAFVITQVPVVPISQSVSVVPQQDVDTATSKNLSRFSRASFAPSELVEELVEKEEVSDNEPTDQQFYETRYSRTIEQLNSRYSSLKSRISIESIAGAPLSILQFGQNQTGDDQPGWTTQELVVGTTAITTATLSVGYVLWLLRGGTLLASFVSTLPAWTSFDPLPIVKSQAKPGAGESLAEIASNNHKRNNPHSSENDAT